MAELTDVNMADLLACCGCCCFISSLYPKFPECIGCKMEGVMWCCVQVEAACCKCVSGDNTDGKCCVWFEGGAYLVVPSTCCQAQAQVCCLDGRISLPPSDKVPCLLTMCPFLVVAANCKPQFACCAKVGAILPHLEEMKGPAQQEMK
eukprot:CAMPEP_0197892422 /NCGR_PEP_ID=MMETSP1439-20131203/30284_1 /TAXON_ID=66791 /ORGANISM="Gonyaulax spinifera, Strain CCMP409" /LENGTH=147 /DNA_ID=CAMNT_0043512587 /DNA_START=87 /DNA_END=530 /DNA_ORIENTATION=-